MTTGGLRGRWAQGLQPRYFTWGIKDRLGAGERPGGFARNHRKVRRQEELIWLNVNGFTHVLSLLDSPHNLHAYDEAGVAYIHTPIGPHDELPMRLSMIYAAITKLLDDPEERIYVHNEEFGDKVLGSRRTRSARGVGRREAHIPQPRRRGTRDRRHHRQRPALTPPTVGS